jgi:hypothetical protein
VLTVSAKSQSNWRQISRGGKIENFNLKNYIKRYVQFICSINENATYSEFDNFIKRETFLFAKIYTAVTEEFRLNLKLRDFVINHQHHPHPFFIACYMQRCDSVVSKEDELKEHLKNIHKISEHAVLTYNFNH